MTTSFSGCLPFCVKLVLCYYCLFSLWRNKYDDDDDDDDDDARYSKLLVENCEIFIPTPVFIAPLGPTGVTRRDSAKVFDTHKTRMIGIPCV